MANIKVVSLEPYATGERYLLATGGTETQLRQGGSDSTTLGTSDTGRTLWGKSGLGIPRMVQSFLSFDVSEIPVGSKIKSATLKLRGLDGSFNPPHSTYIFDSTWDGIGAIATSDWQDLTGLSLSDTIFDSEYSFPLSAWGEITHNLNASGIAAIESKLKNKQYAMMLALDDSIPPGILPTGLVDEDNTIDMITVPPVFTITFEPANGLSLGTIF
ncbi:MAG TPA: hypothetical protein ENJ35_11360 [Gammaproteobacteria bacterium]|nr:hypothetical protein [Gammaproteobacteria bacterium]